MWHFSVVIHSGVVVVVVVVYVYGSSPNATPLPTSAILISYKELLQKSNTSCLYLAVAFPTLATVFDT